MNVGDDVLITLYEDLNSNIFGSRFRIGRVIGSATDVLASEEIIVLDDGGPRIYAEHIQYFTILDTAHDGAGR